MILLAALLSIALLAIAAMHAWWGLGGVWPENNAADLARAVVGDGRSRMPPPWQRHAVAAALVVVAAWPWVVLAWPSSDFVLVLGVVIAAAFFVRGLAGYSPRWRGRFSAEPFATRDARLYSPLCMVLATGFMALLPGET